MKTGFLKTKIPGLYHPEMVIPFPFSLAEALPGYCPLADPPYGFSKLSVIWQPPACYLRKTNGHPSIGHTVSITTLARLIRLTFYQPVAQASPHHAQPPCIETNGYLYCNG